MGSVINRIRSGLEKNNLNFQDYKLYYVKVCFYCNFNTVNLKMFKWKYD